MSKQESTAINDLIHLVQGRIIDHSGDAQDDLFVTARPVAPPAPLPRRRAPNATPPMVPLHDYDDDEAATTVDPHALGADPRFAVGSAPLAMPQPILPQYALLTPAPLPPAPYHAAADATERVERYDALPPQAWHVRPALPASASRPFEDHLETVRVAALPRPREVAQPDVPPTELVAMLQKCALSFAGLAVLMMFVGGYLVHGGQGGHKREVPVVMAVTPAPAQAISAAVAPEPVVAPVTVGAAMVDEAGPRTTTWKPTVVQPTISAQVDTVAVVTPAVEEQTAVAVAISEPTEDEIEMEATTVVKRRKHRARTSSSPAPARVVARVARSEPKPVAAPVRGRKSDPIAVALAEPTKPAKSAAKGTGPGKVTITSTPAALIYIDGRSTNQMTPKTLTLAPGVHKITLLEVSSRKAKTAEVDVAAGGTAQIARRF